MKKLRNLFIFASYSFLFACLHASSVYAADTPLTIPEHPTMYQRVLTLKGARMYPAPSDVSEGKRLAVFSIYYVFAENNTGTWLRIGREIDGKAEGWVNKEDVQAWNMMLVMQFAPGGVRNPALFFERESDLRKIVESASRRRQANILLDSLEPGEIPDQRLAAAETTSARTGGVSFEQQPYVFPILNHEATTFDSGQPATLLEVASVNAKAKRQQDIDNSKSKKEIQESKVGIAFVIDTTISMQPYIDRARDIANSLASLITEQQTGNQVKFAAVGYRNYMEDRPDLEYVSRKFLDFSASSDAKALEKTLARMNVAKVSTHSFSEDTIAGLEAAVSELSWGDIKYRFVFLITDAGALDGDEKSKHPSINLSRIVERAKQKDIAIIPVHLVTPEAVKAGNDQVARTQYQLLDQTGDPNKSKYTAIIGGSESEYAKWLRGISGGLSTSLPSIKRGKPLIQENRPNDGGAGDIIVNEIFRVQQSMIGALKGDSAPEIIRSWSIDSDLANPQRKTMSVGVFLTRNQLSELARSLASILEQAKSSQSAPRDFFNNLQFLAASNSQDPNRDYQSVGQLNLLPSYLSLLPYEPEIFRLTERAWLSKTFSEQQDLINDMEYKLGMYKDIQTYKEWVSLVTNDSGEDVYPIPLKYLP